MSKHAAAKGIRLAAFMVFFSALVSIVLPGPAHADDRDIVSGPFSLAIHGGFQDDAPTFGADARVDYLNPAANLHLFGTYDVMDASSGLGVVDNQRFGVGLALSHTIPDTANVFAGTSVINEVSDYFAQVYFGGKVKVSDNALLSASYGIGLSNEMKILKPVYNYLTAQSLDWAKAGGVVVAGNGLKGNLYYYLTDPGGRNISGLEGDVSYPVTDSLTFGINGAGDLTEEDDVDRNWRGVLYVSYSFGHQRGSVIDVALDKNNPISYPMVIRTKDTTAPSPPILE